MVEWIFIIGLILLGTFLVVAEVVFIPGIFVAGTLGALLIAWSIYSSYDAYGNIAGTITLVTSVLLNIFALIFTFRDKSWERFSLKETHTAKVNDHEKATIAIGDKGITTSVLKPVGKAILNDIEMEVATKGGYITENIEIVVLSNDQNKIIVEKI